MKKVTIYSKENCPFCDMAKRLLKEKSVVDINEIQIDVNAEERDNMIKKTGRMTVPQIFIGELHVGGFDDLAKLNRDGKLDELLGL
ncbi:MAG: glutaredoxin 3 [Proteobacteria bacterium]|nr:glutaredoxin 3 [Pseudomonadota bacterium]